MNVWICAHCYVQLRGEAAGICPSCGSTEVVPLISPRGAQLAAAAVGPPSQAPARPMSQVAVFAVVLSILAAIGAFLPWVSAPLRSVSGLEGDGKIVLVVMLLPLLIGLAGLSTRRVSRAAGFGILLAGVVGVGIALFDGANVAELVERNEFLTPGSGLYVLGLASLFLAVVGLYAMGGGGDTK
jgi:hypothetical protein